MDKRVHYLIGLDTETCNGIMVDDKLDLSQSLVYDLGWVVTDKQGRIYEKKSYVIYETFVDMKDVMSSAYYAEKIPAYWEQISKGERTLASFTTVMREFRKDMATYNVDTVFAHNARFDLNALNNTIRYLLKSEKRYFFPYGINIWDTLKMASDTICKQKTYQKFCNENGYMTNHSTPRPRATAEVLYKYISGDNTFEESHTGLEDTIIETQIMAKCFRQHKKMRKDLFEKKA